MKLEIQKFVDENINTVLNLHKGGCKVLDYNSDILNIELYGGCVNCPSSKITLMNFVFPMLQDNFPQIKEIIVE